MVKDVLLKVVMPRCHELWVGDGTDEVEMGHELFLEDELCIFCPKNGIRSC